jgi:hypothetical protein
MSEASEVRAGRPHRPLPIKAFNAVGRVAQTVGIRPVSLDEDWLLDRAIKKAGSADFGDDDFRQGLRRFLASLQSEANLTLFGRVLAQRCVMENLVNRLRVVDWRKRHPRVAKEEIVAPLFIVGLPRTGTTILHALLEQDPSNRSPLFWEVHYPVPPATPQTWNSDPRIAQEQKNLDRFFELVPGFDAMHPMGALVPQECVAIFTHCFMSEQLQMQFDVPSYQAWLDEQEMRPTYAFHKQFLQHLQSGGVCGDRWLLKSPAHLHLLDTLLETYPDARIIHTHRDPVRVCASVASLTVTLRGASSDAIDPPSIGRQQLDWWAKLVQQSLEQRMRLSDRSEQFFDLKMSELVADPLDVVRRLYAHFDYRLTAETEAKMEAFMRNNPRDKHGSHSYAPEVFGIDPAHDRERFRPYIDHFGLEA